MEATPGAETTITTTPVEANNLSTPNPQQQQPPDTSPNKATFTTVRTTLPKFPFPPNTTRTPILTPRLLLRPLAPSDLAAYHLLRTDPAIMVWTVQGRVDRDPEETREKLDVFLPPNDVLKSNWAICLRENPQELIGLGGVHIFEEEVCNFGWPEVGYMLRREFWGKGLATEFLRGFEEFWGGLEREERVLRVDGRTVEGLGGGGKGEEEVVPVVEERLLALTSDQNNKSHGVLRKGGFENFITFHAKDSRLPEEEEGILALNVWRYFPLRK